MTVFETQKPKFFLDIGLGSVLFFACTIVAAILCWVFIVIPLWKTKDKDIEVWVLRIIVTSFTLIVSYMGVLSGFSFIAKMNEWNRIYNIYLRGECEVVEGYVENFHPMPDTLHDRESFEVSNVFFAYGSSDSRLYYEKCLKDGGFITRNGIKVKIWYISIGEDGENLILRLDILSD